MDKQHYDEMVSNLNKVISKKLLQDRKIFLFGHCNATEELINLLLEKGFYVTAVLDNNKGKYGREYRGVVIEAPINILEENFEQTVVCIVARAYEAMAKQLRMLGYTGDIIKLVEYNSFAEYSLSEDTVNRKRQRMEEGNTILRDLEEKYPGYLKVLCPFGALGDVYFAMSYLPYLLERKMQEKCVVVVVGVVYAKVVSLFGAYPTVVLIQSRMDELVQAALYYRDKNVFIAHHDRPYTINLHKALYVKRLSLEQMYRCGVYGLSDDVKPVEPVAYKTYPGLDCIKEGKAVILSPFAKSVTALPQELWMQIVTFYHNKGYQCFTNVSGAEEPLEGTLPISPDIAEMKSVVERAGTFIGIRSGLCDVIQKASCRKIALYPDYNYCDTIWKAIDIYAIDGWENIVVKEGAEWKVD